MAILQCSSTRFENVQAVLFDKDGTLANSAAFLRNLGQKRSRLIDAQIPGVQDPLLMAFGVDGDHLNPAGLLAVGSRYENEIAAAAYVAETGRDWLESLTLVKAAFQEADRYSGKKASQTPPYSGAQAVLQRLAAAGVKVGLLSSDTTANVEDFVHTYELAPYVQVCQGTDAGDPPKPDPTLFYQACKILAVPPNQTVLVGDSAVDLSTAQAAGAAGFIAAMWGWSSANRLAETDAQIEQFEQLEIL